MKRLLALLLLPLIATAATPTHEQNLSKLGLPMPPNSVFCNSSGVSAPAGICTAGTNISINAGTISAAGGGGGGSLSSVGLSTTATWLTVGNSPLIANGVISLNPTSGLTANQVIATPNGSSGAVSLRSLVAADLPLVPLNSGVTSVLPIANGGTGSSTLAAAKIVTVTGSITASDCVQWSSATVVTDSGSACGSGSGSGITQLTGDVTAGPGTGSQAATVVKVNGAVVPTSAAVLASNGSNQLIAATTTGSGSTVALSTSPVFTTPSLGVATASRLTDTGNGAASTSAFYATGTVFTGGSGTTTFPYAYINQGTSPTAWSTSGTEFGLNAGSGFVGNLEDFHINGASSVWAITYQGNVTGGTYNGSTIPASAGTLPGTTGAFTVGHCLKVSSTSPTVIQDNGSTCAGASSSPGGSSGDVQYNNSGAFGGITVASNNILGNIGSGAASLTPPQAIGALNSASANAQTCSGSCYTLLLSDANGTITMNNGSANAITIPPNSSVAFAVGTIFTVQQIGAGITTVNLGAGVSVQWGGPITYASLGGQYGFEQFQKVATNVWQVTQQALGNTKFTVSGGTCSAAASTSGGTIGGTITQPGSGTVNNCTVIITPGGGLTAGNLWTGNMCDRTQLAIPCWGETSSSTTTITFTVPTAVAASDVLRFTVTAQ